MDFLSEEHYRTADGQRVRLTAITSACVAVEVGGQAPRQYRNKAQAEAYVAELQARPCCAECGKSGGLLVDPLRTGRYTCTACAAWAIEALAEDARVDEEARRRPAELQGHYGKQRMAQRSHFDMEHTEE